MCCCTLPVCNMEYGIHFNATETEPTHHNITSHPPYGSRAKFSVEPLLIRYGALRPDHPIPAEMRKIIKYYFCLCLGTLEAALHLPQSYWQRTTIFQLFISLGCIHDATLFTNSIFGKSCVHVLYEHRICSSSYSSNFLN